MMCFLYTMFIIPFFFVVGNVLCFNLDLQSKVVYQGNSRIMFGFSVVGHKDNNNSWCQHYY
uniref:Uncharacterized protein n=1 Tax=Lepeophtheirus salmonis TaxID=72036 RepID=A0A0K2SWW0_LEPSM